MVQLTIPATIALLFTPVSGVSQSVQDDSFGKPKAEPPGVSTLANNVAPIVDPSAIDRAIQWLAKNPASTDEQRGLTLLALLGSGQTSEVGPQRKLVAELRKLLVQQTAGLKGTPTPGEAIASLALIEHFALTSEAKRDTPVAQRVADRMAQCATIDDLDVETAFWASFALISAKQFVLEVDEVATAALIAKVPLGQRAGAARWDAATTSAASVMLHFLAGGKPDDGDLQPAVETVLGSVARPITSAKDLWRVQLGSLAMYQVGGETWQSWNRGPVKRLAALAAKDGSFPALEGGNQVASTALGALTLAVYYRYARLVR